MKSLAKRLSSMFLALVMVVSVTPFSGALLADETDTETPAVTESTETEKAKETEKPAAETKETKKPAAEEPKETEAPEETEAPKETEAPQETEAPAETAEETEAPKETEAPATEAPAETEAPAAEKPEETEAPAAEKPEETEAPATEAPKETEAPVTEEPKETEAPAEVPEETEKTEPEKKAPDASASQNPKNGFSFNTKIDDKGVMTWDEYPDADDYEIWIDDCLTDFSTADDAPCECDLAWYVEDLIRYGYLERSKTNSYKIVLYGLKLNPDNGEYYHLINWRGTFDYEAKINPSGLGKIKTKVNKGILTWDKYKKACSYWVILCGYNYDTDTYRKFYLNDQIDWLIASGDIEKADSYRVRVVAFNKDGKILADYAWDYEYSSAASLHTVGTVTGYSVTNGILTFDEVENADEYGIYIDDLDYYYYSTDTNSVDINDFIDSLIEDEDENVDLKDTYKITVCAVSYSPEGDESYVLSEGSYIYNFQVAPNPLSVKGKKATIKYKKLKKKKQTVNASKVISGLGTGRGRLTFTKVSGNKKISINKSTGKVTIKKKGLKKGKTYVVKVKVKAAGNNGYDPSEEQLVTFRIKVKK